MENKKNFVISERIIDLLEKNDIQILCGISDSYENEYEIDLQFYSDAGEDFNFSLYDITDDASFIREFENYADFFDADEHASLYIENRGTHGIPNDIKTLIEDAESIKEKLQNVADELNGVENERGLTVDVTLDKEDLDILVSNGLITNRTDKEQVSNALLNAIRTDVYKQLNEVKQIIKDTIEDITDENNIYIFDNLLSIDEDTVLKAFHEYTNHREYYNSFEDCLLITVDNEYDLAECSLNGFREIIESYIPKRLKKTYEALISQYDGRFDTLYEEQGLNNIYCRAESCLPDNCYINLMFGTPKERNFDMGAIADAFVNLSDDADSYDNALTALIQQQGHTVEEVQKAYSYSIKSGNTFVDTVVDELNYCSSTSMNELTALVSASGKDLLNLLESVADGKGFVSLPKQTEIGLFNEWNGGGAMLEIALEKDAVLPVSYIRNLQIEGHTKENNGYTVDQVYGLVGSVWEKSSPSLLETYDMPKSKETFETMRNTALSIENNPYYFLETGNFFDDKDKMSDYQKLTKEDFLKKYDDETEHSYLNTAFIVKMKSSEKSKSHSEFNRE